MLPSCGALRSGRVLAVLLGLVLAAAAFRKAPTERLTASRHGSGWRVNSVISVEEVVLLELCRKGSPAALREAKAMLSPLCQQDRSALQPFFHSFQADSARISDKKTPPNRLKLPPAKRRALKRMKHNVNPSVRPSSIEELQRLPPTAPELSAENVTRIVGKFQMASTVDESIFWNAFEDLNQKDTVVASVFLLLDTAIGDSRNTIAANELVVEEQLYVGQKRLLVPHLGEEALMIAKISKLYHLVGAGRLGAALRDVDAMWGSVGNLPSDVLSLMLLVLVRSSRDDRRRLNRVEKLACFMSQRGDIQLLTILEPVIRVLCRFRKMEAAKEVLQHSLTSLILNCEQPPESKVSSILLALERMRQKAMMQAALKLDLGIKNQLVIRMTPALQSNTAMWENITAHLWSIAAASWIENYSCERMYEHWCFVNDMCARCDMVTENDIQRVDTEAFGRTEKLMKSADTKALEHLVTSLAVGEQEAPKYLFEILRALEERSIVKIEMINRFTESRDFENRFFGLPPETEVLLLQIPLRLRHANLLYNEALAETIVRRVLRSTPRGRSLGEEQEISMQCTKDLESLHFECSASGKLCHAQIFSWRMVLLLTHPDHFRDDTAPCTNHTQVAKLAGAAIRRFGERKGWYGYGSPFPAEVFHNEKLNNALGDSLEIDFHGMTPEAAAITLFLAFHDYVHGDLQFLEGGSRRADCDLRLIVGKGLHSKRKLRRGEIPRLKGFVLETLHNDFKIHARVDPENTGALIIDKAELALLDGDAIHVANVEILWRALHRNWSLLTS